MTLKHIAVGLAIVHLPPSDLELIEAVYLNSLFPNISVVYWVAFIWIVAVFVLFRWAPRTYVALKKKLFKK